MDTCALCDEKEATETCDDCGSELCTECLEDHEHCHDCDGTGERTFNVLRNQYGDIDYLHGTPSGETDTEICRRCEQTGLRF